MGLNTLLLPDLGSLRLLTYTALLSVRKHSVQTLPTIAASGHFCIDVLAFASHDVTAGTKNEFQDHLDLGVTTRLIHRRTATLHRAALAYAPP